MLSSSRPQQTRTTRRTRLAGGAAMHLSSHAGHPRSATSDKTQGSQALARPTASKRVSSPPIGSLSLAPDVTDDEIETASLEAVAARRSVARLTALIVLA